MAIPTLLLPLDGSLEGRNRGGMFTATGSGALRFVTGYGGEPATYNYYRHPTGRGTGIPAFAYSLLDIVDYPDRVMIHPDHGGIPIRGVTRLAVISDGSSSGALFGTSDANPPLAPGTTITYSCLVEFSPGMQGRSFGARMTESGGEHASVSSPTTIFTSVDGPMVVEVTHTIEREGRNALYFYINALSPSTLKAGEWVDVTAVQCELGDTRTPPTMAVDASGNLLPGHGWIGTPEASHSYREAWALGGAALVEEGTTNYCKNPLFFNNASLWSNNGHNPNLLPSPASAAWGWNAGRFFRLSLSGALGIGSTVQVHPTDIGTFSPGDPVTVTAVVRTSRAVGEARVEISAQDGLATISEVLGPYIPLVEGEQTLTLTVPSLPAGTVRVRAGIRFNSGGVISDPVTFDILSVQIEKKAYPTSLCPQLDRDGNLLPGYSWTGAAHASASTREAASIELEYPHAFGEAVVRYSEDDGETWQTESTHEPGAFGTYGTVDLSDGVLTVGVTSHAVLIDQLIVFDRPLTDPERTLLMNADPWEWQMLYPRLGGVLRVDGGGAPFSVLRAGYGEG